MIYLPFHYIQFATLYLYQYLCDVITAVKHLQRFALISRALLLRGNSNVCNVIIKFHHMRQYISFKSCVDSTKTYCSSFTSCTAGLIAAAGSTVCTSSCTGVCVYSISGLFYIFVLILICVCLQTVTLEQQHFVVQKYYKNVPIHPLAVLRTLNIL